MTTEIIEATPKAPPALTTIQPMQTSALLQMAMQSGASMDMLERLIALHERNEANEARKAFNAAFAGFKAEGVRIVKNIDVKDGPLRGKRYADLFAVVDTLTPVLSKHGLSASWKLTKDEKDWLEVTCLLAHVGGHTETVSMGGPPDAGGAKNAIQARASAQSYLRRYTFLAITGMAAADEDDDGNGNAPTPASVNAEATALINVAEAKAQQGSEALRKWWESQTEAVRTQLMPRLKSLKATAKQADAGA